MSKTKILVPGPIIKQEIQRLDTIFGVSGSLYRAQAWDAKRVKSHAVLRVQQEGIGTTLNDSRFKVQTRDDKSKRYPEVSCQIADGQSHDDQLQVLVRLERIVDIWIWSIKAVLEMRPRIREHKHHRLFVSKTPSDGCKVTLLDGRELYIGLQRLAAANHPRSGEYVRQQQYQIFIRPLEEG